MTLRYPPRAAGVDVGRAVAGLALTAGPVALASLAWPVALALGLAAVLFAAFGLQALGRARLQVTVDEEGLRLAPGGARIPWASLEAVTLAYYSLRRDGERGWFELVARGPHGALRVDSRLEGFDALVRATAGAALRRGIALDPATRENLVVLTGSSGEEARGA